ncbi:RNHCP domain-containing protein [Natronoglycomyces albus]|uniref:RNHCP domain-containing protein n=1 Tax=Natronoglycomyces albus TaxID=2811108 RepID=A0A895XPY7_9ACTN|nr:RNHCP domain-containing protein [Natronoglycomyces albus]
MAIEGSRFTRRKEDFECANCRRDIKGNGYTNHCPHCLWSRHVDISPGDRQSSCRGLMEPIGSVYEGGGYIIVQRCQSCDHLWRNKASRRDSTEAILALMGKPVPWNKLCASPIHLPPRARN